jgi:hypothetical protein
MSLGGGPRGSLRRPVRIVRNVGQTFEGLLIPAENGSGIVLYISDSGFCPADNHQDRNVLEGVGAPDGVEVARGHPFGKGGQHLLKVLVGDDTNSGAGGVRSLKVPGV